MKTNSNAFETIFQSPSTLLTKFLGNAATRKNHTAITTINKNNQKGSSSHFLCALGSIHRNHEGIHAFLNASIIALCVLGTLSVLTSILTGRARAGSGSPVQPEDDVLVVFMKHYLGGDDGKDENKDNNKKGGKAEAAEDTDVSNSTDNSNTNKIEFDDLSWFAKTAGYLFPYLLFLKPQITSRPTQKSVHRLMCLHRNMTENNIGFVMIVLSQFMAFLVKCGNDSSGSRVVGMEEPGGEEELCKERGEYAAQLIYIYLGGRMLHIITYIFAVGQPHRALSFVFFAMCKLVMACTVVQTMMLT